MEGKYRFEEIGGYFVASHAVPKAENCWATFVCFEKKGTEVNDRAPAVRHHLRDDSRSEADAIQLGIQHAWAKINAGDTGL